MASEVWGIDIGKSAVKAVKMRRIKNQIEIIGLEIIEYEVSDNENVDKDEQIRQALQEFQTRVKLKKTEKIFVSIPGQATFNRMITIPPVEPRRIKEIVTYEAQQQIPFPIDEVLWDFQAIGDVKTVEEREIMLFAVRKEIINNFLGNLAAVQIAVEGIQIAPLALYNFIRYDQPELETCVLIDIGAENTDLVIVHGDKLWLRALPSAGNDITKALQKKFNIPLGEAEKLKIKAGKTKQAKKIFEVIKPVLKDIVGEIHRSVGYYKSMAKDIKFDKMIFLGNSTKLAGFDQFFSQNLQYNVELLTEVKKIRVSPQLDVNRFQANIAGLGVAMGLGIQGLDLGANSIRLLPKEIELRTRLERQKPLLALAVGLLAIVPIGLYLKSSTIVTSLKETQKKVNPVLQSIQKYEDSLKEATNYAATQKRLDMLSQVGNSRYRWVEILNSINKVYSQTLESGKDEKAAQKTSKIWVLDVDIEEKEEVGDKEKDPNATVRRYAEVRFKISFQGFKDAKGSPEAVKNLQFVNERLKEPLENYNDSNQQPVYDKTRSKPISVESKPGNIEDIKDIKAPNPGEYYCHATLQLVSWLD
jgi:type IV pilus assembly protein PilM